MRGSSLSESSFEKLSVLFLKLVLNYLIHVALRDPKKFSSREKFLLVVVSQTIDFRMNFTLDTFSSLRKHFRRLCAMPKKAFPLGLESPNETETCKEKRVIKS